MTANDKIAYMHSRFGKYDGEMCKECQHYIRFLYHDRYLLKCEVYGLSHSEATDWRASNTACGLFNQETEYRDVYKDRARGRVATPRIDEALDGQIGMEV